MDSTAFIKGMEKVTGKWCKQRKREERHRSARANRWHAMTRARTMTIKDAAWQVMEKAYMKASANGRLPAHARQIMYAARAEILQLTEKDHLNDQYFTQTILPDYMRENSVSWDVVYDARGHFAEPHTSKGEVVPLGTISVRNYLNKVRAHTVTEPEASVDGGVTYPTCGPRNRFGAVLFIEKEGFTPLFEEVQLAERYDLAIMSTKGVSNIASRRMVDRLCGCDVPLFVLHDFDEDGFKILNSLRYGSERYRLRNQNVIDLGLRMNDVLSHGLETESSYARLADRTLRGYGATAKEIEYLRSERAELNAFASDELIEWLEKKLKRHGVKKVIPDAETQAAAYHRAVGIIKIEEAIEEAIDEAREEADDVSMPDDLDRQVRTRLKKDRSLTWDQAIADYAREQLEDADDRGSGQSRTSADKEDLANE